MMADVTGVDLISAADAAKQLGCSVDTIWRRLRQGRLTKLHEPGVRTIRIPRAEIDYLYQKSLTRRVEAR